MTPLSSNTSLEFLVKDPNGQCYKIQLDPNHLENTKATLVCGEKEKSVKVIFNYSLAITNTEQVFSSLKYAQVNTKPLDKY